MMTKRWDYKYELINFERSDLGIAHYQTKQQGNIHNYHEPGESSRLLLKTWRTARDLAEKTLKDVVVYVIGKHIIPRVRTVNSSSFY